jgi:hypothetical protein
MKLAWLPEFTIHELVPYWLGTPSLTFQPAIKQNVVSEVFIHELLIAGATRLP